MKIKRVDHLGVIVGDLDEAVQSFTEHLGLELDHTERYGDELDIAFLPCGETLVELITPRTKEGSNADYLKQNGPGIQHVAFEVDDLDAALIELSKRGVNPWAKRRYREREACESPSWTRRRSAGYWSSSASRSPNERV